MQQTSKYQFNLVEGSDDFSPTPLNQNMEKVEEALEGMETAVNTAQETAEAAQDAAEALPYVTGRYTGAGATAQSIALGFKPSYLIISGQAGGSDDASKSIGIFNGSNMSNKVTFTNTGFTVSAQTNDSYPQLNRQYAYYGYIAFR